MSAVNSHNGHVIWQRHGGRKPSTPAIAGPRLIVSSHDGTVTAYDRFNGRRLWRLKVAAKVESSPVAIGRLVYFGATDGRLFAVYVRTGHIKWAYDTGGRINSSPSILGNHIFVTTYAGSIWCLRRSDGHKVWDHYIRRDVLRYESFYASVSTDGRRLFTISRSGGIYALSASNGRILWRSSVNSWGYSTPAVAHGRVLSLVPFAAVALIATGSAVIRPYWSALLVVHLVSFVVLALACHGELYRRRPEPARLTEFYLWTSFGGVIGGIFAGPIAPHVFNGIAEYSILILAAPLAMPGAFAGWAWSVSAAEWP